MEKQIAQIAKVNPQLAKTISDRMGFVIDANVPELISIDPNMQLLVRCGNGRFICPVSKLAGIIHVIDSGNHKEFDYVRDVSFPVNL